MSQKNSRPAENETASLLNSDKADNDTTANAVEVAAAAADVTDYNKYRKSVWIMILVNLLDNINFAIVIPSLWPYIQSLRGSKDLYGFCVAAYSLMQFLSAPLYGFLSNYIPYRFIFIFTLSVETVSCILYALAQNPMMILIARLIAGTVGFC